MTERQKRDNARRKIVESWNWWCRNYPDSGSEEEVVAYCRRGIRALSARRNKLVNLASGGEDDPRYPIYPTLISGLEDLIARYQRRLEWSLIRKGG